MEDNSFPSLLPLINAIHQQLYPNKVFTENLAGAFASTGDKCLDFFASIVRNTSVTTLIEDFVAAWNENPDTALRLVLNLRDIRGGKGEKKLPLTLLYIISCWKPLTYLANLKHILDLGCYKDLLKIAELAVRLEKVEHFGRIPQLQVDSVELKIMAAQLMKDEEDLAKNPKAGISLCAKWAPTESAKSHFNRQPLRFARKIGKFSGVTKKEYRQKLTKLRGQLKVIEKFMCTDQWDQIDFPKVPAKAHRLYKEAFKRSTNAKKVELKNRKEFSERYAEYLVKLTKGEETIKSTGTQPHELVNHYLASRGEGEDDLTIEGQWKDLIAKLAESGKFKRCQAVADVSGSMDGVPMQVSIALGLVVAELTEEPFRNKLITFHETPTFHTITGNSLRERVQDVSKMEWGGSTNLLKVFEVLLAEAEKNPGAQMVEKLFIFTDMQFDQASPEHFYRNQLAKFGVSENDGEKEPGSDNDSSDMEGDSSKDADGQFGWKDVYGVITEMYQKKGFRVPQIIFWNLRATLKSFAVEKNQAGTALMSGFSAAMLKCILEGNEDEFNPISVMNDALKKYEEVKVPEVERTPFDKAEAWKETYQNVMAIVDQHLVPQKKEGVKGGRSTRGRRRR